MVTAMASRSLMSVPSIAFSTARGKYFLWCSSARFGSTPPPNPSSYYGCENLTFSDFSSPKPLTKQAAESSKLLSTPSMTFSLPSSLPNTASVGPQTHLISIYFIHGKLDPHFGYIHRFYYFFQPLLIDIYLVLRQTVQFSVKIDFLPLTL